MQGKRALLLINAKARLGGESLPRALDCLRHNGFDLREIPGDDVSAIPDLIRRHAGEADLVILGGGDGTMNRCAEAVVDSGLPLGILPLGTANDLARTLGIPVDLDDACAVIAAGRTHRIDLGRVNGKYFFNVASMGMSVRIARDLSGDMKRRWGVLGYFRVAVGQYRAMRSFSANIETDGRHSRIRSIQLSVGNGRFYGGGMMVSEDAAIDDGMLDLYSLAPGSLMRLLALFPALRAGRHKQVKEVHYSRARHIEVRTRRAMPINTDGELTTETPAIFDIVPQCLTVFVPAARSAPGLRETRHAAA